MRYLPHTSPEIERMLQRLGLTNLEELYKEIPDPLLEDRSPEVPPPLSEMELMEQMKELSERNGSSEKVTLFIGGGVYSHYIPSHISQLLLRSEFLTAYTPYQPEVSQGTLQAVFEFQTLICQLFGMEIANASMYDGASATAEAALMAMRIRRHPTIAVARSLHPHYRETLQTYTADLGITLEEIPWDSDGTLNESNLKEALKEPVSALIVQSPNFFGAIEPLDRWGEIAHQRGALFIVVVTEPLSLGILKPPGDYGADIVTGEGQSLGLPLSFGGPYVGLFACKKEYVRQMPGRLVGETVDAEGKRGYVVTLATREQHIRRARATSNICTNQGLCALAVTLYLSTLGKSGLRDLAILNLQRANAFKRRLQQIARITIPFKAPTFNEFVIQTDQDGEGLLQKLLDQKIVGGLDLGRFYPELHNHLLIAVTETTPKASWEKWIDTYRSLQGASDA